MNIYAFASRSRTNIWAGIGRGLWAVSHSPHPSTNKGRATKAAKMPIGSFGLIYCSENQTYNTPFVVLGAVHPTLVIADVWPEPWILPFEIRALGNPSRAVRREEMYDLLPSLKAGPSLSVDDLLEIKGVQAFNASTITEADWAALFEALVI
ncbi:MAG: hypothetical protein JWL96_2166 [Sphingomonas bacterium]|uniref:hypothetical protein n=1 Tax=Sphingomonas bacterium TaxID=1895847 RepID=UPI002636368D|nr:hypothetical protein [Sphingomonas bacterium]MDB5710096.1 hypothetical protein [Sphingomonas bacterium]